MLRTVYGLPMFLLLLSSVSASENQSNTSFDSQKVSAAVESYLRRNTVPGAVVVVTDGDRVVYERGFGHDSAHHAMTVSSLLPIASLSKSLTAAAVLQLVERGRISLDQPVVQYLPELLLADQRFRRITIRQLLTHTSGMSDRTFREKSLHPVPVDLRGAVASLRSARLAADPGSSRSYHNPNYWVAARLVEVVSGQTFDAYLCDHILLPAGMTASRVVTSLPGSAGIAMGNIRMLHQAFATTEPQWFLGGCCGILTTGHDLGKWLLVQNGNSQTPVSEVSRRAMREGFGWTKTEEEGHTIFGHNGVMFTYSAQQYVLPDVGRQIGIAVVTNTGLGLAPLPAEEIAQLVREVMTHHAIKQPLPVADIVDGVTLMLIISTLAFVVRRSLRRPLPSGFRTCCAIAISVLSVGFVCNFAGILRALTGRDIDGWQSLLLAPLIFLWVVVLAVGSSLLAVRRLIPRSRVN